MWREHPATETSNDTLRSGFAGGIGDMRFRHHWGSGGAIEEFLNGSDGDDTFRLPYEN
jgi:hypothetical protein